MAKTLAEVLRSNALVLYGNELGAFTALIVPARELDLEYLSEVAADEYLTDAKDPVAALAAVLEKANRS